MGRNFNDSDIVNSPFYTIGRYICGWLFWGVLSTIEFLFICPLSWRCITADIVGAAAIAGITLFRFRGKGNPFALKYWWFSALLVAAITAVMPFIVSCRPIYFSVGSDHSPLSSEVYALKDKGRTEGTVIVVADIDVVRRNIASLSQTLWPRSVRVLEKSRVGGLQFYMLPVLNDFVWDIRHPGDTVIQRSVYIPLDTHGRAAEVELSKADPLRDKFSTPPGTFFMSVSWSKPNLLNFTYNHYPNSVPWNAVTVDSDNATEMLHYMAFLDRAIESFASGLTEHAMELLDCAAEHVPPSNLEAARVTALQYLTCVELMNSNLELLQAYPYLHRATDLFLEATSDRRYSDRDPLVNWLADTLRSAYVNNTFSWVFSDRINKLQNLPRSEVLRRSNFDELDAWVHQRAPQDLLRNLKAAQFSTHQLRYIRNSVVCDFMIRTLRRLTVYNRTKVGFHQFAEQTYAESKITLEFARYIDSILSRENHLTSDKLDGRLLELWVQWYRTAMETKDPQQWFHDLYKTFPEYKDFFETSMSLFVENSIPKQRVLKWRETDWWAADHLLWFAAWAAPALEEIDGRDKNWKTADGGSFRSLFELKRDIPKLGDDYFIRDRSGNGRVFVPALFVLAWYKQEFKIEGFESNIRDFETATGVPMEVYRNVLYDNQIPTVEIP